MRVYIYSFVDSQTFQDKWPQLSASETFMKVLGYLSRNLRNRVVIYLPLNNNAENGKHFVFIIARQNA